MRLDGFTLALEPLRAVASLDQELRRWALDTPRVPALAEAAERGAEQCRVAARRLDVVAGKLDRIAKAASS